MSALNDDASSQEPISLEALLMKGSATASGSALLALRRFARRGVRQVGIAAVSLLLTVGLTVGAMPQQATLGALATSETGVAITSTQARQAELSASAASLDTSVVAADAVESGRMVSAPAIRRSQILQSSLTHHHLTGARLSIAALSPAVTVAKARAD